MQSSISENKPVQIPKYYPDFIALTFKRENLDHVNVNSNNIEISFFNLPNAHTHHKEYENGQTFSVPVNSSRLNDYNTNPNIIKIKFRKALTKGEDFFVHLATEVDYENHKPSN